MFAAAGGFLIIPVKILEGVVAVKHESDTEIIAGVSPRRDSLRVVVTGGGTGGHISPGLAVVRALGERSAAMSAPAPQVLWVGEREGMEQRSAQAAGIEFRSVAVGKIRRSANPIKMLSPANIADMARVPVGMAQARAVIKQFRPHVVLATGGYVAVPVGMAASSCSVPLVVHEQTTRLGLTNRVLASRATRVAVSTQSTLDFLPQQARERAVVTGNPVRPELLTGQAARAWTLPATCGFDRRLPTLYVTGGSQGARQINTLVRQILPWLLERANVVHQCGQANQDEAVRNAATLPPVLAGRYWPTGYLGPELPDVFALADVVLSRSGAGTIAELTALGKASVLVPLASSAGGEQASNADYLHRSGAAIALRDEVDGHGLAQAVGALLGDADARGRMARAAGALGRRDAAASLVQVLLAAASQ
ncbi:MULTISPECIES: UDP-N-acetylglucosamine--N-acetylmuramyl-(pentapeptide) pyrophosphoryl-undecaprenol N-acetylglucosamine transferase [Actinosynnema]|uniref:UDP-N-acetylglucosamine--N-acetylmuramyl- (pentapeptide) pyrophosphoryl-undecaprenol N-acetylglucosamine transferase n=1 Tax=Actinosynnema TaxID=40566 RepID=UPI0020A49AD5|nr:UDP-N-acetylglucosamine--N-acetylmuramyl-(pentapeptide) pyrophosphoryl-undecaprenol N-acetylglucosamine transferase [Actinosynnema pretiosum]MCP2097433.1 UDP-N-acetylglucosamine-N-acetylmuramylpentapeptide N-acetylglucosamine transferase [Actinosynnema pretiosum]